jgi:imidazolonepropionase-like amidohydrolase
MRLPHIRRAAIMTTLRLGASAGIAKDLVIHAGTHLDGISATAQRQVSILVHDDRIIAVQAGFTAPAGAEVIDLSDATVMPGFIDCHVRISAKLPGRTNATEDWLTHTDIDRAFAAAVVVRQMLQRGFTSARDVGGGDETVAVRNAINDGKIPGPRLWLSLEPLGPTGGHADPQNGLDAKLRHPGWENGIVDTPEEARLRVREHKRRGATLIKLMPSGGIASSGDDPNQQLMTNGDQRCGADGAFVGDEGRGTSLPACGDRELGAGGRRFCRAWLIRDGADLRADEGAWYVSRPDVDGV